MNSKTIELFLAATCLLAYGCGDPAVGSSELSTRSTDSEGSAMAPCDSDLDCPQGEECEFEHGESFCKPHGGDDGGPGDEPNPDAMDCESDLDCPQGEECEFEHGASFCKPHGGDDEVDDDEDEDCEEHEDHDDDEDHEDRSGSNSGPG